LRIVPQISARVFFIGPGPMLHLGIKNKAELILQKVVSSKLRRKMKTTYLNKPPPHNPEDVSLSISATCEELGDIMDQGPLSLVEKIFIFL